MTKSCPKEGGDDQVRGQDVNILCGLAFLLMDINENLPADNKSQNQKEAVPAERQLTPGK